MARNTQPTTTIAADTATDPDNQPAVDPTEAIQTDLDNQPAVDPDNQPDAQPEPAKLTAAERRDIAAAAFRDLLDNGNGTPESVAVLFGNVPQANAYLDQVSAGAVTAAITSGDMTAAQAIVGTIAAIRDALPVPTTATSAPRPVDPAAIRLATLDAMADLVAIEQAVTGLVLSRRAELMATIDLPLTDDEEAHVHGLGSVPDVAEKVMERLTKVITGIGTGAKRTVNADGTARVRTSAAEVGTDPRWLTPGSVFRHGDDTCTVVTSALDDRGNVKGEFTVKRADGTTLTATSPSSAAVAAVGHGSWNGKKFWK